MIDRSYCFLFHTHLPWLKNKQHWMGYGSWWYYECVADCYLPLLKVLHESRCFRSVVSLSFPLLQMMADPEMIQGVDQYLRGRIKLSKLEIIRNAHDRKLTNLFEYYLAQYEAKLAYWSSIDGDLINQFKVLQTSGCAELIATAGTHALLPQILNQPGQLKFQIDLGCQAIEQYFHCVPKGFWLPECAWDPALEQPLLNNAIEWTVIDSFPEKGGNETYSIRTPNGLTIFQRHPLSARLIWDARSGYPSNTSYREFYRDIGWELDPHYVDEFTPDNILSGNTGLKHLSINGDVYDPDIAMHQSKLDAQHFVRSMSEESCTSNTTKECLILPFDTELFGHWWYEGPQFIDEVIQIGDTNTNMAFALDWDTPSSYLENNENINAVYSLGKILNVSSSWGQNGDFRFWMNPETQEENSMVVMSRIRLWQCFEKCLLSGKVANESEFAQAMTHAITLMALLESSDWIFMISAQGTPDYGRDKILEYHGLLIDTINLLERSLDLNEKIQVISLQCRFGHHSFQRMDDILQRALLAHFPHLNSNDYGPQRD